jgi:hypothetical protein
MIINSQLGCLYIQLGCISLIVVSEWVKSLAAYYWTLLMQNDVIGCDETPLTALCK